MKITLQLNSETDTDELGRILAEHLPIRCLIALDGTLGAGKTRLTQSLAKCCGIPVEEVTSPTFTLWQTYSGIRTIHHLDAYRIKDEDEFDALGVEECFEQDALTLIEWASRIEACLPNEGIRLNVLLEVAGECARTATLESSSTELAPLMELLGRSNLTT